MTMRGLKIWMICIITMLQLIACTNGDDEPKNVLTIYVYGPGNQQSTRGEGDGDITASEAESSVKNLQIWVFETGTNNLVGYLEPSDLPSDNVVKVYQMAVSNSFAYSSSESRPHVDVYVAANVSGLSLGENSTRDELEVAMLGPSAFGTGLAPVTDITTSGLPMSGVLRNQTVVGDAPVLRIGNYENMAEVTLKRAVSKVRFVFCQPSGHTTAEDLNITKLELDGSMIPTNEYLFLGSDGNKYRIGTAYNTDAYTLQENIGSVCSNDSPIQYAYSNQTAQEYETLISTGVTNNELTQAGPFYLHETDKRLSGLIYYKVGTTEMTPVPFAIEEGGNFWRNHSWIVYAYRSSGGLELSVVQVDDWTDATAEEHSVHNW